MNALRFIPRPALPLLALALSGGFPLAAPQVMPASGFVAVSTVVFTERPDLPHRLEFVARTPSLTRWHMQLARGPSSERELEYRSGSQFFRVSPRQARSVELLGLDRLQALRRMELRRAAMLWPGGVAWTGTGAERSAELVDAPPVSSEENKAGDGSDKEGDGAQPVAVGQLRVNLDENEMPIWFEVHDGSDAVQERLVIESWQTDVPRPYPSSMRLEVGGQVIWREDIERFRGQARFVDSFFIPPDRRPGGSMQLMGSDQILNLDLRAITFRSVDLKAGVDWDAALLKARQLIDAATAELADSNIAVDQTPTFEVSPSVRPLRCIVRLREAMTPPPAEGNWQTLADRPGLLMIVSDRSRLGSARLELLRSRVPADASAGAPYVRFSGGASGERIQLALPFVPR